VHVSMHATQAVARAGRAHRRAAPEQVRGVLLVIEWFETERGHEVRPPAPPMLARVRHWPDPPARQLLPCSPTWKAQKRATSTAPNFLSRPRSAAETVRGANLLPVLSGPSSIKTKRPVSCGWAGFPAPGRVLADDAVAAPR
jgi:hypothetical protein